MAQPTAALAAPGARVFCWRALRLSCAFVWGFLVLVTRVLKPCSLRVAVTRVPEVRANIRDVEMVLYDLLVFF